MNNEQGVVGVGVGTAVVESHLAELPVRAPAPR
jgi:hypothetical protein